MHLKKIIVILAAGCIIFGIAMHGYAMPLYSMADNNFSGIFLTKNDECAYAEGENNRYNLYYRGRGKWTHMRKKLNTIFSTDTLIIDYDISFDSGLINSYAGFPVVYNDNGKSQSLFTLSPFESSTKGMLRCKNENEQNENLKYIHNGEVGELYYEAGKILKLRILCDLDQKVYKLQYDCGSGYTDCFTGSTENPVYEWALNTDNIKEIRFLFIGADDDEWQSASLSYFNIYDSCDKNSVYVDKTYEDGDGSYDMPFSDIKSAEQSEADIIQLKNGNYVFNSSYTFGTLESKDEYGKKIYVPVNGNDVGISGAYNIDIPELSDFPVDDKYKNKLESEIRNKRYTAKYYTRKVNIFNEQLILNETSNDATFSAVAKTNSFPDNDVVMAAAVYNQGRLECVVTDTTVVKQGSENILYLCLDLPNGFSLETHTVKAFVFCDMKSMSPLIPSIVSSEYSDEIPVTAESINLYEGAVLDNVICSRKRNVITLEGDGRANDTVTIVIYTEKGNIKYLNQCKIDEDGRLNTDCILSDPNYKQLYVYIGAAGKSEAE